jgi:hypothetical protein
MIQARPIKNENPGLDRKGRRKRHPIEQRERYRLIKVMSIGNNFMWAKRTIGTVWRPFACLKTGLQQASAGLDRTETEGAVTAFVTNGASFATNPDKILLRQFSRYLGGLQNT